MEKIFVLFFTSTLLIFSQSGTWSELNTISQPSVREGHVMTRISDDEALLFGGRDAGTYQTDTWIFNNNTSSWTQITPPTNPAGRTQSSLARISDNEALLFGGYIFAPSDDTWKFDNISGSWTQIIPPVSPSARSAAMLSRVSSDEVLLFGGHNGANEIGDTWIFNNTSGSWTQISPPVSPSSRQAGAMARISDNEVLLFGGNNGSLLNDTWIFNNTSGSWTQINTISQPSARSNSTLERISDNELLLFSGNGGSNETWVFNNTSGSWTQISTTNQPGTRYKHKISRVADKEIIIFGGFNGSYLNDTWRFEILYFPDIYNFSINQVSKSSASFSADIADRGESATITFEYGFNSGNYSNTTTSQTISGSSATTNVGFDVTSLESGTFYYAVARAENSVSFSYSEESSFWTLVDEPASHSSTFWQFGEENTTLELRFNAFSGITNATGYLIIRSNTSFGENDYPSNSSTYNVDDTFGNSTVVANITDNSLTSHTFFNQQTERSWQFALIPYSLGDDEATANYLTSNAPTIQGYTIPTLSEWGMIAFGTLMLIGGVWFIRRLV
jgi:hypothetical protein